MMRAILSLTCCCLFSLLQAADEPAGPIPMHDDPEVLRRAVFDTVDALVRDDTEALEDALSRIESGCRRADRGEAAPYPQLVVGHDKAMHNALDAVRRLVRAGQIEQAIMEFRWILRGCHGCHVAARENGIPVGSESATSSSPAGSGSPSPPSESTPSR